MLLSLAGAATWTSATRPAPPATTLTDQVLNSLPANLRALLTEIRDNLQDPRSDRAVIWSAQQQLVQACMSRAGHTYHLAPFSPIIVDLTAGLEHRPRPAATTPGADLDINAAEFEKKDWREAYSNKSTEVAFELPDGGTGGSPTGGCLGDSLRFLYGDDLTSAVRAEMVALNTIPVIVKLAIRSPEVVNAIQAWHSCLGDGKGQLGSNDRDMVDRQCRSYERLSAVYCESFAKAAMFVLNLNRQPLTEWKTFTRRALARS